MPESQVCVPRLLHLIRVAFMNLVRGCLIEWEQCTSGSTTKDYDDSHLPLPSLGEDYRATAMSDPESSSPSHPPALNFFPLLPLGIFRMFSYDLLFACLFAFNIICSVCPH